MKRLIVYVHGKGGSAQEAEHYKSLFPKDEVIGFDYRSQTPWQAKKEFFAFFSHCTLLRYLLLCLDSLQIRFSDRIDALMHRLRIWVNV